MNLVKVFLTEGFVSMYHPVSKDFQNSGFEDKIYPGMTYQDGQKEDAGAGVEGQDIRDGHQGQTVLTEALTHILGYLAVQFLLNSMEETLESRCLVFLTLGVADVEEEIQFVEPLAAAPSQAAELLPLLLAGSQFAALLAQQEP